MGWAHKAYGINQRERRDFIHTGNESSNNTSSNKGKSEGGHHHHQQNQQGTGTGTGTNLGVGDPSWFVTLFSQQVKEITEMYQLITIATKPTISLQNVSHI